MDSRPYGNKMIMFLFIFERFLRKQDFFTKQFGKIKKYIVFSDQGKHFKSSELMFYWFHEIAQEKIRVF